MTTLKQHSALIILIDMQEKLIPHIFNKEKLITNTKILLNTAQILSIPVLFSEQYPKGLGKTVKPLLPFLESATKIEKTSFSIAKDNQFIQLMQNLTDKQLIICGVETHICVAQSVLQLLEMKFQCFVAADATSARNPLSHELGLARMKQKSANIINTEMAIFEFLSDSKNPAFKEISALIK